MLSNITDQISNYLKDYNPKILTSIDINLNNTIIDNDNSSSEFNNLNSELINFYYKLIKLNTNSKFFEYGKNDLFENIEYEINLDDSLIKIINTLTNEIKYLSIVSFKDVSVYDTKTLEELVAVNLNLSLNEVLIPIDIENDFNLKDIKNIEEHIKMLKITNSPELMQIKNVNIYEKILNTNKIKSKKNINNNINLNDSNNATASKNSEILDNTKLDNAKEELKLFYSSRFIVLIENSQDALQRSIKEVFTKLNSIGIVGILEDIYLEYIFFSLFPGNTTKLKRKSIISNNEICSFVISNPVYGDIIKQKKYYTYILISKYNTPFYYNFYSQDNKNNLIIIKKQDNIFLNFLLAINLQKNINTLYINTTLENKMLAKVLNLSEESYFNIFELIKNKQNHNYIFHFFAILFNLFLNDKNEKDIQKNLLIEAIILIKLFNVSNIANIDQLINAYIKISKISEDSIKYLNVSYQVINYNDNLQNNNKNTNTDTNDNNIINNNDNIDLNNTENNQNTNINKVNNSNLKLEVLKILYILKENYSNFIFNENFNYKDFVIKQNNNSNINYSNLDQNLNLSLLSDSEFYKKYYPASDERKIPEFLHKKNFNHIFKQAYLFLYLGIKMQNNNLSNNVSKDEFDSNDHFDLNYDIYINLNKINNNSKNCNIIYLDNFEFLLDLQKQNILHVNIDKKKSKTLQDMNYLEFLMQLLNKNNYTLTTAVSVKHKEEINLNLFGHLFNFDIDKKLHTDLVNLEYKNNEQSILLNFDIEKLYGLNNLLKLSNYELDSFENYLKNNNPTQLKLNEYITKFLINKAKEMEFYA
ncbi:MAG: hypothetical protein U1E31_02455 [Rickettsiales bacterium]